MQILRAIIVDDEAPARDELQYLLTENCPEVEIVGQCDNAQEALMLLKSEHIDLIFLDIEMPETTGLELASYLTDNFDDGPFIVFVSAYDQFAIDAFRLNATDYLLKPVSPPRLTQSIQKVIRWKGGEQYSVPIPEPTNLRDNLPRRITLNAGEKLIPLNLDEVIVATVEDKATLVFTDRGRFQYSGTLVDLESQMNSSRFFRCHKSFLINLFAIESIDIWFNGGLQVKLRGFSEVVPVSRNYAKDFKKAINFR